MSTTLGMIGLAQSARGLVATTLPQASEKAAIARLYSTLCRFHATAAKTQLERFEPLVTWLRQYASGQKVSFPVELDMMCWTDFQRRVWNATKLIPYGETRSYSWVARAAGAPAARQATGQALHHNSFPLVIPCHRVIGANGALTGFGEGLEMKRKLLTLEGIKDYCVRQHATCCLSAQQPVAVQARR